MAFAGTQAERVVAFDAGNSAVKCAVFAGGEWQVIVRVETRPLEGLSDRLRAALRAAGEAVPLAARCVVSSVCPAADRSLRDAWKGAGGAEEPRFFGRDIPIPMKTLVRRPERVGVDRLLCARGARELVGAPAIVVGVGTAITVDKVDRHGRFAGGAIAPGLQLAARSLHDGTACLPAVEVSRPERAVGLDTVEAMQSGIYSFCRGGISELIRLLRAGEGCEEAGVVVTGGDAELLLPLPVSGLVRYEPNLIFLGMSAALSLTRERARDGPRGH